MRAVAEATGGFYVHLVSGRAEMQMILRDGLEKMTEHEIDVRLSRQPIERYQWPLSLAVLALGIAALMGERRRGSVARIAVMLIAGLPLFSEAKNLGVEAFEQKDYTTARTEFDRQLARQPDRAEMQFNLGSAAYKQGDLDMALGAFSRAVTSPDPALRGKAAYNLGNTLFQRGARQQEKEARKSEWKNAIQHYDEALKVDPKNADAIYNRDLVLKLLEEQDKQPPPQKQQQEQKQDQSKKGDQKKDQQEQKDQKQDNKPQQGDQQKQDQQPQPGNDQKDQQQKQDQGQGQGQQDKDKQNDSKQSQNKPDKPSEGQKGDQQPQASSGDEKEKDSGGKPGEKKSPSQSPEKSDAKEGQSGDQEKQQAQNADGKKGEEKPGQQSEPKKEGELKSAPQFEGDGKEPRDEAAEALAEAQAAAEGKMTPQQARALLDSLKSEDDKVRLMGPTERRRKDRVFKDW
jgi:Ca-activated chloride channel family protein